MKKKEHDDNWWHTHVRWLMIKRMFYLFDDFTPIINYHRYIDDDDDGEKNRCRRIFFSLFSLYAHPIQTNWSTNIERERDTKHTLSLSVVHLCEHICWHVDIFALKNRPEEFNTNELCVCVCEYVDEN
jgi:hypothetical protein